MRNVANFISESFIWGVGITRPKPGKERQAALFITALLLGVVLGVLGVVCIAVTRLQHGL